MQGRFGIYNETTVSTTLPSKDIEKWEKRVEKQLPWENIPR